MKALVERLATGVSVYETPDAEISENRISALLECGETTEGAIEIKSKGELPIKGFVFATDSHVQFQKPTFNGTSNSVKYTITSDNLEEGQVVSGTISIVTDAGDYAIPFGITIKQKTIHSNMGDITDYKSFVKLVRESYDEALILFLSKEFRDFFLKDDSRASTLYTQCMRNTNRDIAMEEFLVGMDLKDRIEISINNTYREYTDISENYSHSIKVKKSVWGYTDIDVEVEGDFFYNVKDKITGDEFSGNIMEYQYFINAARLHGGSNHGRITFKTSNETLVYDLVIVNSIDYDDGYVNQRRSSIEFVKNYLQFRTGEINGDTWKKNMSDIASQRLKWDDDDMMGLFAKAQVAILDRDETVALETLNHISGLLAEQRHKDVREYSYYLYLKTLFKNDPAYTEDIKKEVKEYFENGHDSWQVLWVLFYIDERYEINPSLKYQLAKRGFNHGCTSPVMYYEIAQVFVDEPTALRSFGAFEVQVLQFIARHHMATEELAKQVAELMDKEKEFNEVYYKILVQFYEETESKYVLSSICSMIINGKKYDTKFFPWLEKGVEQDVKITNLYEYYIYTIDTTNYDKLLPTVYKYFSYGTNTLLRNRDYYFANIVYNFSEKDKLYKQYRDDMEQFATEELLENKNNVHLRYVYERILNDDFIVGDLEEHIPDVLHTHMVKVKNENIKQVIVAHKEIENVQLVDLEDGVAYVQLYTKAPVFMYVDNRDRVLSKADAVVQDMSTGIEVTKTGMNPMIRLSEMEDVIKHPKKHKGHAEIIKDTLEIRGITEQYFHQLQEFAVQYYYDGYDMGEIEIFPLEFDMDTLSTHAHNQIIEILLKRNHLKMTYQYIAKFGYQGVDPKLIEKLCIELVQDPDYANNEILVEMAATAFRNGCRDEGVIRYIGEKYEAGSLELHQICLAVKSLEIEDKTIAERLLVQLIFENDTSDKLYDIYQDYLRGTTSSKVRKAFYTYVAYNYFIKKVQCMDVFWDILEEEYANEFNTPMICKIAFIEVMSKKSSSLSERQIEIVQRLINDLAKDNIYFEFYKKFHKWVKIPFRMADKTIIDFRTNPKHRVEISYTIHTPEGHTIEVSEEMGSVYQGIFTKEIVLFYGEEIDYSITEFSDELPEGKVVDHYSVKISEKDAYNDETRFGMINTMMICKDLGRDKECTEMMQNYELDRIAGQKAFKLL